MALRTRILAQGDEIVSGSTLDTNSRWLAQELTARGATVVGIAAGPDDAVALRALLEATAVDCDLVVSSGGLGPTSDDCTAEAAAAASGRPLREDPLATVQIAARFARMGRPMPDSNRKQALLPQGATLLENAVGTAPGFALDLGRARAFFFPGVPRELKEMAATHLWPWLEQRGLAPWRRHRLHVCGVGESALQDRLQTLALPHGVRLGYQCRMPINTVLIYADGALPDADAQLARVTAEVRERLGDDCLGDEEQTLPQVVGELLTARGLSLALAESCTAGGAAALLTQAPGSSAWLKGGVVAYANEVKQTLLGVPAPILAEHGAVSEACAAAMAEGARRRLGADVGVSITGVAGPSGGTADKPVGTVCFGIAGLGPTRSRTVRFGDMGREVVRALAAHTAIEWLRRTLSRGA